MDRRKLADMKKQIIALKNPWCGYMDFIRSHLLAVIGVAFFLGLIYGGQAFSNYYYIDKDGLVNHPGSFYNWGDIGRFGLILMKKVLGMSWYNPYLAGVLFLLTLWAAAMAAGCLFYAIDPRLTTSSICIFLLLFLVYPTYVEQFLFQFQAFEVVMAIFFLLVSDRYLVQALRDKNRMAFCASVPLVVIAFGIYQSMVPLQLCLYLGIFLMLAYAGNGERKIIFSAMGYSVFHFVLVFGIYGFISQFFQGGNHLNSQVVWLTDGYDAAILRIRLYINFVVRRMEVGYTLTYDLCCAAGLAALLVLFLRRRFMAVWYGLGVGGVILSPFFLTIVTGDVQPYRVQMTLPLACGVLWLFGFHVLSEELKRGWEKRAVRTLLTAAGCVMIFVNVAPTMRLLYTRDVVGKADELTAAMIARELGTIPSAYEGKPVIFIGSREPMTNNACYESGHAEYGCSTVTVFSAFEMEDMFEPYYFFSSRRIIGFFRTLGIQCFQEPSDIRMMPSAYEDSSDMPVWPLEGSVREFGDYIIVKLGQAKLQQY